VAYPKIELHVHFEGTVQLETSNAFDDFAGFIAAFEATAATLLHADDFRRVVVEYAEEAARHGAVYLEGIFTPGLWRGLDTDEVFTGYCDGAQEARERHGIEVRLTPDIPRVYSLEEAQLVVDHALKYRDRGVVGVGLAGDETYPPEPYAPAFARATAEGLASVPHAGEHAGPASIRGALDALGAVRIRHGIRAVDDEELLHELAERQIVLDVCPTSNVCTKAVPSIEEHPLPRLLAAGVLCSLSTDDPALFDTDLTREYEIGAELGLQPREAYAAGLAGALCDAETKARLTEIGASYDWDAVSPLPSSANGQS
jgi:aminodeoxyfutalosine deaminase